MVLNNFKLRYPYGNDMINKYDAPILVPLARKAIDGDGVKEDELVKIGAMVSGYALSSCGTLPW